MKLYWSKMPIFFMIMINKNGWKYLKRLLCKIDYFIVINEIVCFFIQVFKHINNKLIRQLFKEDTKMK